MTRTISFYAKKIPLWVGLALLPGAALSALLLDAAILLNALTCVGACLVTGYVLLSQEHRKNFIHEHAPSVALTGLLLALTLPTGLPLWLTISASIFTVLMGRLLLRSLRLNSVMLTFAVLLIVFPAQMSLLPQTIHVDALSSATPLEAVRNLLKQQRTFSEISLHLSQTTNWMWVSLGYLLGGLFLIRRGIIAWQVPTSVLAGLLLPALLFWATDADRYASPAFHALTGSTMLGAFFIATDPASAASTLRTRVLAAFGIGALTWLIRTWGRYPDGFAFAVLLVNLATPALDAITRHVRTRLAVVGLLGLATLALSLLLIAPYQSTWAHLSNDNLDQRIHELAPNMADTASLTDDRVHFREPMLADRQDVVVYRLRKEGQLVAAIFRVVAPDGYNGDIELLVGLSANGELLGTRVLQHQETRGLGDREDQQFSGATITRSAIDRVAQRTQDYFLQHQRTLSPTR